MPREPRLVRAVRHGRFLLGGGQPSDQSYGRGVEESRREKRLKQQSLPAALRARAAVSARPSGPCRVSSASRLSPGSFSLPHCCDFWLFFLPAPSSPLPCTCFLHLCLTSSLSPSFRSSLSLPCSPWLFFPSLSLSVWLPITVFAFPPLCPIARRYFCRLWDSLSGSLSLWFKVFLLSSVARCASASFSISLYSAPCPSF